MAHKSQNNFLRLNKTNVFLIFVLLLITNIDCLQGNSITYYSINRELQDQTNSTSEDSTPEDEDEAQEKEQLKAAQQNENTKKDFDSKFDSSEDFTELDMEKFQSGLQADQMDQVKIENTLENLKKNGAIMEFLEPKARSFSNVPQDKKSSLRINCGANDGSWKSHYLTKQSSTNYFQWRVKRIAKNGNCTIRISTDGKNYIPLTPAGFQSPRFTCGRSIGYESAEFKLPKSIVKDAVVQMEFETELGTVVQCADIIVQQTIQFIPQKCEPHCKNGGVCMNGKCKCSKMYSGDTCDDKIIHSSSFSLMLFLFVIGLVAAGIALLYQRDKYLSEMKRLLANTFNKNENGAGRGMSDNTARTNNQSSSRLPNQYMQQVNMSQEDDIN